MSCESNQLVMATIKRMWQCFLVCVFARPLAFSSSCIILRLEWCRAPAVLYGAWVNSNNKRDIHRHMCRGGSHSISAEDLKALFFCFFSYTHSPILCISLFLWLHHFPHQSHSLLREIGGSRGNKELSNVLATKPFWLVLLWIHILLISTHTHIRFLCVCNIFSASPLSVAKHTVQCHIFSTVNKSPSL